MALVLGPDCVRPVKPPEKATLRSGPGRGELALTIEEDFGGGPDTRGTGGGVASCTTTAGATNEGLMAVLFEGRGFGCSKIGVSTGRNTGVAVDGFLLGGEAGVPIDAGVEPVGSSIEVEPCAVRRRSSLFLEFRNKSPMPVCTLYSIFSDRGFG